MKNRELYKMPKSEETQRIIKSSVEEMEKNNYITISGFKGIQFNNEIFVAMLRFKDLAGFLEVFGEVQREVSNRKVSSIKNYIITGLHENEDFRFFPSLTVTSRGSIFYDESTRKIAIDTYKSKLSVTDGQHRFGGIKKAIEEIEFLMNKAKFNESIEVYRGMKEKLENMVMPLTIFNNLSEAQEKQLFYDLNNLAQRPSRSTTIKLSQTDGIALLARRISLENQYLKRYGVEMDKTSIHKNNENTILLTTIYAMIKNLLKNNNYEKEIKEFVKGNNDTFLNAINEKFNSIFSILPKDMYIKKKYVFDKSYVLRGVASFYADKESMQIPENTVLQAIGAVNWDNNIDVWKEFGAYASTSGIIMFSGASEGAARAIYKACEKELSKLI